MGSENHDKVRTLDQALDQTEKTYRTLCDRLTTLHKVSPKPETKAAILEISPVVGTDIERYLEIYQHVSQKFPRYQGTTPHHYAAVVRLAKSMYVQHKLDRLTVEGNTTKPDGKSHK